MSFFKILTARSYIFLTSAFTDGSVYYHKSHNNVFFAFQKSSNVEVTYQNFLIYILHLNVFTTINAVNYISMNMALQTWNLIIKIDDEETSW